MNGIKKYSRLEHIELNPRDIKIDFDEFSKVNILVKEIYNCEITGTFTKDKGVFHGNIVMSYLRNFSSKSSDFSRVDWKDSNIRNSNFVATSFDFGAIINCHIAGCTFHRCHYENVSITGSDFFETVFIDCDLSHMVIENCNFYKCKFVGCKSSNKLFEQCLLINCFFKTTDIQLNTITENFGIVLRQVVNSNIRDAALDEKYKFLTLQELHNLCDLQKESLQNIFKFKIEYFLKPTITLNGSPLFDKIFDLKEWLPLCKARATFLNLFKLFHDFIVILFEQNKLSLYAIFKLRELTKTLCTIPQIKNDHEFYPALIGYDISLSRILSQVNKIVDNYERIEPNKIVLLVRGPLNSDYYYNVLRKFVVGDFKISKLIKQNSPNLLEIVAMSSVIVQIVSLFVTTRVKVELADKWLKRIGAVRKTQKVKTNFQSNKLYQFIDSEDDSNDLLKMYFTSKQIHRVRITDHSSKDFGKIRRIIIDIHERE